MKDPVFKGEEEWRLIRHETRGTQICGLQFRTQGALTIPYVLQPLSVPATNQLPITEVVLGPTIDSALGQRSVEMLLKSVGIEAKIVGSKVPLRGMA